MTLYLDHGDFVIKQTPIGIQVNDGSGTIKTNIRYGDVTYIRTESGGTLYINGNEVGQHYSRPTGTSNQCSYYGTGTIRNVFIE